MNQFGVEIVGSSHCLGSNIQSNNELCAKIVGLTPEWILEKTGIKNRYHVAENETASSLATEASKNVITKLNINKEDINLIIVASFSQDYLFPPLSAKIHQDLQLTKNCQIIDINTNCVGIVTALTIATERMKSDNTIKNALVIGVEILSPFTNPHDKDTAIFFSDGAAAIILGKTTTADVGFKSAKFLTDSTTYESVRMRGGGSMYPLALNYTDEKITYIEQNGLATWKQAITNLPTVIYKLLDHESIKIEEIDFFIFHQANGFLIDYLLKKMKIPESKTYTNVQEIGNTGAASIGIALSEAYAKGLIKPNSNIIIAGVGAGFNFGACLFKT